MKDEFDVEKGLRRYDAGPGEQVKKSVMDEFTRRIHEARAGEQRLWRRPVPFYRAAIAILFLVALSFAAGREFASGTSATDTRSRQAPPSQAATWDEIDWVAADSDLL